MAMAERVLTSLRRTRFLRTLAPPDQPQRKVLQDLKVPLKQQGGINFRKLLSHSLSSSIASTNEEGKEGDQITSSSISSNAIIDEEGKQGEQIASSESKVLEGSSLGIGKDSSIGEASEDASTRNEAEPVSNNTLEFEASIKVSAPLLGLVIGRRGATLNGIQKATKARIKIPPGREVRSGVSLDVKGPSQEAVDAAVTRIKNILQRAEKNPSLEYSHFISVPLASHQNLVEHVRNFRESVLVDEKEANNYVSWFPKTVNKGNSNLKIPNAVKAPKIKGLHIMDPDLEGLFSDEDSSDEEEENNFESNTKRSRIRRSFFVKPETFHLTFLMLKLYTEQSVHLAAEVLQGVQPKVLEVLNGHEPKVHLRGIENLRGNPAEARVIYMRVHEVNPDNPFHRACYVIRDAFIDAGLVAAKDRSQEVKLHATLMNANYAPRLDTRYFDARKLLMKHRNEDWGEYTMKEVHLSQRFFYDPNGYYRCCGSLELPQLVSDNIEGKNEASEI